MMNELGILFPSSQHLIYFAGSTTRTTLLDPMDTSDVQKVVDDLLSRSGAGGAGAGNGDGQHQGEMQPPAGVWAERSSIVENWPPINVFLSLDFFSQGANHILSCIRLDFSSWYLLTDLLFVHLLELKVNHFKSGCLSLHGMGAWLNFPIIGLLVYYYAVCVITLAYGLIMWIYNMFFS